MRGSIPREHKWDVVVDLFFYREPEEAEKEEQAAKEQVAAVKTVVEQPVVSILNFNYLDVLSNAVKCILNFTVSL